MVANNPNGYGFHEPRCPDCGRFDASCKCDWPMPSHDAPTTPPDDEALEVPNDA